MIHFSCSKYSGTLNCTILLETRCKYSISIGSCASGQDLVNLSLSHFLPGLLRSKLISSAAISPLSR
uniref:Uncharacterized protein n=1 Tax=Arundo donax TaxID=35708 RepID=A0A0A9FX69_ARUDO